MRAMPPQAELLSDEAVARALESLPGWDRVEDTLVKSFRFRDFAEAVRFVASLVPIADGMDHHPDVSIHWNAVELILWTHVSGGITHRDVELARAIEAR
jgi:4a-hydroxytetrahydrobiopterin dehydratase